MQATKIRPKNQITLPAPVVAAAGLAVDDEVSWRFEGGEIRGVKLVPQEAGVLVHRARLVKRGGRLVFTAPMAVPPEAFAEAAREERAEQ